MNIWWDWLSAGLEAEERWIVWCNHLEETAVFPRQYGERGEKRHGEEVGETIQLEDSRQGWEVLQMSAGEDIPGQSICNYRQV